MTYDPLGTTASTPLRSNSDNRSSSGSSSSSIMDGAELREITKAESAVSQRPQPQAQHNPQDHESVGATLMSKAAAVEVQAHQYANGYHFPPKYPVGEQVRMGLAAFWQFYNTGFGFFLTIYALNVVAWGGMLFLLLCNAAPPSVMCWPDGDCDAIDSPRRIWIETDCQVVNGLFCVTGFGLAPWRARDLYYLMRYRLAGDRQALRVLAGVHRPWFRLPGSDRLPAHLGPKSFEDEEAGAAATAAGIDGAEAMPHPPEAMADPPPTGQRAPPTRLWKMDVVVWMQMLNTGFQVCLSTFMWAMDRYTRPSWATGLFVCLACIVAGVAGVIMGIEGKNVKMVEGVPLSKLDVARLARDRELGIPHYNNYQDRDPAKEAKKKKANKGRGWFGRSEKNAEV